VTTEILVKSRLIRIGNSRGVRLPKPLIEEAGLDEEVEVQVRGSAVVISSRAAARTGWADAARLMRERGDDRLLDAPTRTRFDDKEWRWR
jgi:antitoxin MazE